MAKLNFKYGAMESGKSLNIIQTAYNYEKEGYSVLVLKSTIDTKAGDKIITRFGDVARKVDALLDSNDIVLEVIKPLIKENLSCILVDEAQFLTRKQVDELFFITKELDIPVICYGLRTDFQMNGFPGSTRLLEIAEQLEELPTLCSCKEIARYNARKYNGEFVSEGEAILIDGSNKDIKYVPICGKCYLEKVKKIKFDK